MIEHTTSGPAAEIRTFLFADLRGYTRFTQLHGDDAASALASAFAELVRDAVPRFGGLLLELRGDEALCVFLSARQALRAACDLQRRLRSPHEGEPFPVGVGIGLDAGEAVPTQGGYRGGALNLAARLCSLAEPGQILASETVVSLAARVEGVRLGQRRVVRVKGLSQPARIVEVAPERPLPPPPPVPGPRAPRRGRVGGAALAAAAIVVVGLAAWYQSGTGTSAAPVVVHPDSVVVIDPKSRRVVADVPLPRGSQPGTVISGFGAVWVSAVGTGDVVRIDPSSLRTRSRGTGIAPSNLATGGGSVLVYDGEQAAGVAIHPGTLQVSSFRVPPGTCPNGPGAVGTCFGGGMAVGGGHVWVATTNSARVWRLDPHTLEPDGPPVRGLVADVLAWGLGGLWAYGNLGQTVYRIDPVREAVSHKQPIDEGVPQTVPPIVIGNGLLWALAPGTKRVYVLNPAGGSPSTITLDAGMLGAWASGQLLWVTSSSGKVYEISMYTQHVLHVYRLPHPASGVTVAFGRVWVAVGR